MAKLRAFLAVKRAVEPEQNHRGIERLQKQQNVTQEERPSIDAPPPPGYASYQQHAYLSPTTFSSVAQESFPAAQQPNYGYNGQLGVGQYQSSPGQYQSGIGQYQSGGNQHRPFSGSPQRSDYPPSQSNVYQPGPDAIASPGSVTSFRNGWSNPSPPGPGFHTNPSPLNPPYGTRSHTTPYDAPTFEPNLNYPHGQPSPYIQRYNTAPAGDTSQNNTCPYIHDVTHEIYNCSYCDPSRPAPRPDYYWPGN